MIFDIKYPEAKKFKNLIESEVDLIKETLEKQEDLTDDEIETIQEKLEDELVSGCCGWCV